MSDFALPQMRRLKLSPTLSFYIARQFCGWFFGLYVSLAFIIFLVSIIDLVDRLSTQEKTPLSIVIEMALYRLPFFAQEILPFTILGAGMFTFWKLTRTNELVVARAAGISAWQFLLPAVSVSLIIGVLAVGVLNPISAVMLKQYDALEARYIKNRVSELSVSQSGLWLRQPEKGGQTVIHAQRAAQTGMTLQDVTFYVFKGEDDFVRRIDAKSAQLLEGQWLVRDAHVSVPGVPTTSEPELTLPTTLTSEKILDSFSPPETISFWNLPGFIRLLERAGFRATRHLLQFHKLLSLPMLFTAMVLLSASFSLRPQRRGKVGVILLTGVVIAFMLYFLTNFVFALGLSGKIPVLLAAWSPAGISLMIGATMLLHLEDG
ncbi:lipopolysaccharide export system permease protein [Tistlia consotensis]|uniref:Lipopolysaccharide export system permease protein n=1 Tax=Tistlia consotensis USBA 355 TaxID=560819 RepID=A0A1Y6CRB3_9PROT|nr:LPS export ABC transporter permease LptG [Tistlia consotensis]SMF83356.1 lipopolysaccharide export system permease protein [Tistlia consotensis USBA 355]SNS32684.1 lipopolysaccharide export system permease protein [Tistlia consotensis]